MIRNGLIASVVKQKAPIYVLFSSVTGLAHSFSIVSETIANSRRADVRIVVIVGSDPVIGKANSPLRQESITDRGTDEPVHLRNIMVVAPVVSEVGTCS